jgi:hypothetical protein
MADRLDIKLNLKIGLEQKNFAYNSTLFRPWRRVVETGKPIGNINFMFLDTGEPKPQSAKKSVIKQWWKVLKGFHHSKIYRHSVYILGSICYSPEGLLLYFPGFCGNYVTIYDKNQQPMKKYSSFFIDHFSLERGFSRWHITPSKVSSDDTRIRNLKVTRLNANYIHWFGLSIQEASELESLCQENHFSFIGPSSDMHRRTDELTSSREGSQFHIIEANDARTANGPFFFHFDFIVKEGPGIIEVPKAAIKAPIHSITEGRSASYNVPVRVHPVKIPNFEGVLVVSATKFSGTLSDRVIISY